MFSFSKQNYCLVPVPGTREHIYTGTKTTDTTKVVLNFQNERTIWMLGKNNLNIFYNISPKTNSNKKNMSSDFRSSNNLLYKLWDKQANITSVQINHKFLPQHTSWFLRVNTTHTPLKLHIFTKQLINVFLNVSQYYPFLKTVSSYEL